MTYNTQAGRIAGHRPALKVSSTHDPSLISISRERFLALYPGRSDLYHTLTTKPKDAKDLVENYLPSKLWRLNNLYYIKDKHGSKVLFKLNPAQWIVYAHLQIHPRLLVLKSRQQGISTLFLVSFYDDTIFMSNLESGLMAQDQPAATKLLDRVKFLWDNLDPSILAYINRRNKKQNASECSYNNDSQLFIRTSFRSATLQRLHISELGKIANKYPDKAKETKTGTLQTLAPGNVGIIESTAEGNNMFKHMFDTGVEAKLKAINNIKWEEHPTLDPSDPLFKKLWSVEYMYVLKPVLAAKDFYPIFLSWVNDPDCVEAVDQDVSKAVAAYFIKIEQEIGKVLTQEQRNFWVAQERELEGSIHQEYPATPKEAFSAAKDGTFWARKYIELVVRRGRKVPNLYDVNLPVYCVMDLGRNDYNVLTFFQFWVNYEGTPECRIVWEYFNTGEGLDHYAQYLLQSLDFMAKPPFKPNTIKKVGLPHDAMVVDLSAEGGKTRQQILRDEGIDNTIVLAKTSKKASIDEVRSFMQYMFISDDCPYLETCFLNYTREWNDLLNTWRDDNKRDDYAHGADTIRYMVQYINTYLYKPRSESSRRAVEEAKLGI